MRPFDVVAYRDGEFHRVQVKYRSAATGHVEVAFKSAWTDRHGVHERPIDKAAIDLVCIYCPETDECYYLRPDDHGQSVTLRITPSRNGQKVGVLHAADFRLVPEVPRPSRLADHPRRRAIHSSTASGSLGSAADRLRTPSAVTTTSSSIRMPMPRSSSGTSRSSSWK